MLAIAVSFAGNPHYLEYFGSMNFEGLLDSKVQNLQNLLSELISVHGTSFGICAGVFNNALRQGDTIFWCGNGGSASESSHLATELIGRFKNNRNPLPSISLNSDTSVITCIANDFGYGQIYSRQLEGLAKAGDLLIVLSTSGNSENIVNVLKTARLLGVISIALLGNDGGQSVGLCDHSIVINSNETARIQEIHLLLGHTLCELADMNLSRVEVQ
jgi:D-sedoheptulose 7-phosphate isomerase